MRFTFILIFTVSFTFFARGQNNFSKEDVLEDLQFLRSSLEEAHYNLYAYTSKEEFNQNFEKVKESINKDSLSLLETTSFLQAVISKANNGHTEIPFPGSVYIDYAYSGGTLFPLELAFEDDKAIIRKNWSDNEAIETCSEILSINDKPMDEVLQQIFPLISAERDYFKLTKLELFSFPRLYWQAFGQQDSFKVEIKQNGEVQNHIIKSVSVIDGYEKKRDEIFSQDRKLEIFDNSAYLKPGNFGGNVEQFRRFIDSSFVEINKANLSNLIIDLRNNLGGDNSFSDYLVSYIADRPFRWYSKFTLRTSAFLKDHVRKNYDTTQVFWKSVLSHEDGTVYTYEFEKYNPQPEEKRFMGEVYVLVNRQSHSQSAVTAAQIQDYNFGIIVGEETGDYPSLYASQFQYNLPNTGIPVKVSKGYIVRVNGSTIEQGVIPDIMIKDHLLDESDEILNGLLKKID